MPANAPSFPITYLMPFFATSAKPSGMYTHLKASNAQCWDLNLPSTQATTPQSNAKDLSTALRKQRLLIAKCHASKPLIGSIKCSPQVVGPPPLSLPQNHTRNISPRLRISSGVCAFRIADLIKSLTHFSSLSVAATPPSSVRGSPSSSRRRDIDLANHVAFAAPKFPLNFKMAT